MCSAELRTELRNFCHDGLWRETTCRACLAILAGNTERVIRSKLISITCYRVKIDVNPFCFMVTGVLRQI